MLKGPMKVAPRQIAYNPEANHDDQGAPKPSWPQGPCNRLPPQPRQGRPGPCDGKQRQGEYQNRVVPQSRHKISVEQLMQCSQGTAPGAFHACQFMKIAPWVKRILVRIESKKHRCSQRCEHRCHKAKQPQVANSRSGPHITADESAGRTHANLGQSSNQRTLRQREGSAPRAPDLLWPYRCHARCGGLD